MEPSELNMLVAANIDALMKQRGFDAAKLARAAKLGPTGIYDILSGRSQSPRVQTLAKIAAALGVPVDALLKDRPLDELHAQLYEVLMALEPSDRERLLMTGRAWVPESN